MTHACRTIGGIPDGQRDPTMSQRAGRAEAGGVEVVVKQRAQKRTCGKGGRIHPQTSSLRLCWTVGDVQTGLADMEIPGREGANCVGISQGTMCGLKEDCLDMLMSAWIWEGGDGRMGREDL